MDIPTPTPLPPPSGTALPNLVIDGAEWTRQVATEGVQWWNIINQNDIISYAQLALLAIIVIVGIVMIMNALNGDEENGDV